MTTTGSDRRRNSMHRILFLAAIVLAFAAMPSRSADTKSQKDNTPPEGFTALFNGKDLTNWKGLVELPQRTKLSPEELTKAQKEADKKLSHWKVEDGVIRFDGKGENLQTAKDYGNFELYVDWKIKERGDSGIYLRGNPQVQIWDSDHQADNLKDDWHTGSGGLWNNQHHPKKPLLKADKSVGDRDTVHIIMKRDNGMVIIDGT